MLLAKLREDLKEVRDRGSDVRRQPKLTRYPEYLDI